MQVEHESIPAMAQASAARWGERPAVIDGDVELSFEDVARLMVEIARALVAKEVEPGDRIAVWAPNCVMYVPAMLGIQAAGAWAVPINTRLHGEEAAFILGKVDARALFVVDGFLDTDYVAMLRSEAPELKALGDVIDLPGPGKAATPGWDAFLSEGQGVPVSVVQDRIDALTGDDVSDIMFTSGTTGLPKGVPLRHGASLWAFCGPYNVGYRLDEHSHHLVITPFFHCFGYKAGWMMSLALGATTYPLAVFDPLEAMRIISEHGITHMPGSPTMFSAILDHPRRDEFDFSTLHTSLLAAANVPARIVERVRDELDVPNTLIGYGLTEHHALVSVSQPDDGPELVSSTVGRVIDGIEVRIVDDDGTDVPVGETGEIICAGPLMMSGYYADEEATAQVIVDGWLHTGDVGHIDEAGYLTITDRKKDIYIMGGFNVAPAEVERVLLRQEGVAQVAVVGMADDHFGEVGAAFVIRAPGSQVSEHDVVAFAREHLANYKVPRKVVFVDEFPLNATGKVLKHELRAALN